MRENKLPAKFNDYVFAEAENPRSRVRQFQHLKDNALFKRIEDLPAWQQMQEMVPWFRPVDGIIVYLHDVEGYHVRWSPTAIRQPDSFASQLQKMGFPGDLVFRLRLVYSAYRRISKNLERFLTVLAGSTPVHVGLGLPTPGVTQTTFSTHSPTTRDYTLVNQPVNNITRVYGETKADKYKACMIARMEFFQDTRARKKLITLTWSRLRLLDPTLLPWGVDESIATKNPQVLDKDHLSLEIAGRERAESAESL